MRLVSFERTLKMLSKKYIIIFLSLKEKSYVEITDKIDAELPFSNSLREWDISP